MKVIMQSLRHFKHNRSLYITLFKSDGIECWGFTVEDDNSVILNFDFGYESEDAAIGAALFRCCTNKILKKVEVN